MKAFRYAVTRRSIIEETFWVEADSSLEALEMANNGDYSDDNIQTEWIDWYDDHFEMSDIEPEPLDPLYKMVKEYDTTRV